MALLVLRKMVEVRLTVRLKHMMLSSAKNIGEVQLCLRK